MLGLDYRRAALGLLALVLMHQVCAGPVGASGAALRPQEEARLLGERRARRTPLWRVMGAKPNRAYCRDHYECSTRVCRKGQCAFNDAVSS